MKVCPSCRSRYEGDVSFCPSDGSRLVDISRVAENWTGRDLTESIHLGDFWESTPVGDRYVAHDDQSDVRLLATLLNRRGRLDDESPNNLQDFLADKPPSEVLAIRDLDVDPAGMPPWVVEEHPKLPSLRHRLDDMSGGLDWEVTVRIAITAGRILHWMAKKGHVHTMLHPGAIYTDEAGETVRLGDWLQGEILGQEQQDDVPQDLDARWRGFIEYSAPELFDDGAEPDGATLVYSLGVVVYESITGETPFGDADDLERAHRNAERPSLSDKVGGVHPELDEILKAMLSTDRSVRFDHPEAAAAALASLLSASLKTVCPDIQPRDTAPFAGVSDDNNDDKARDDEPVQELSDVADESAETGETLMGMPAASTTEESDEPDDESSSRESVLSGESESIDTSSTDTPKPSDEVPTIIIEDSDDKLDEPDADHAAETQVESAAETVVDSDPSESQPSGDEREPPDVFPGVAKETLRAWHRSADANPISADLSVSVMGFVDIDASEGTLKLNRVGLDDEQSENSADMPPTIPDEAAAPSSDSESTDGPAGDSEPESGTDSMFPDESATEGATLSGESQTTSPTEGEKPETVDSEDSKDSDDNEDPVVELRESDVSETSSDSSDKADARDRLESGEDFEAVVSDLDRGENEIDDPDDFENEWFSKSSEDAWMEQDVREGRDKAEEIRRYLLWAGIALLVVTALGIVLYAEFGPTAETDSSNNSSQDGRAAETATDQPGE